MGAFIGILIFIAIGFYCVIGLAEILCTMGNTGPFAGPLRNPSPQPFSPGVNTEGEGL